MAVKTITNKELQTGLFSFAYVTVGGLMTVEVNEVEMSGWTILECYLPQQNDIVYFDWNAETATLTLLDLSQNDLDTDHSYLIKKLLEIKRSIIA